MVKTIKIPEKAETNKESTITRNKISGDTNVKVMLLARYIEVKGTFPNYFNSIDSLAPIEEKAGLRKPSPSGVRAKYSAILYDVITESSPKGAIISNSDLILASATHRAESLGRLLKLW